MAAIARWAALPAGASLAYIVGHDGSPAWRVLRVAVVAALAALLWWSTRLPSDRRARLAAFAAGLPTIGTGAGIALPHVAKSGPVGLTLAGSVALVAGLFLAVWAGAGLVRPLRWRWRLLAVPAALVLALVAVPALGLAVAVNNVPRTPLDGDTPATHGLAYEDVTFTTRDGVTLSGWYIPSENGAAVALMHGAGSNRSGVLDQAVVLARNGYGVLLFDARGHGESGGRAMDFGWYGDADVSAAVDHLVGREDVDPDRVGAVGMSMGGEEAIGAAASDSRIAVVVAEGATGRVAADRAWLDDEYGLRGWLQQRIDGLTFGLTDLLTSASPPRSLRAAVAATAPRPVLLIAAGDVESEPLASRYIAEAAPESVEVWVVPDTGHTDGLATHPAGWEERVVGFLDAAL